MRRYLIGLIALFAYPADGAEFAMSKDPLTGKLEYSVRATDKTGEAVIAITCTADRKLRAELISTGLIITPDGIGDKGWGANVTHRFDSARKPTTSYWGAPYARLYRYLRYRGDMVIFIKDALNANDFALRLDSENKVLRFSFRGAGEDVRRVALGCTKP